MYEEDKHIRDLFCFIYVIKQGISFSENQRRLAQGSTVSSYIRILKSQNASQL